MNRHTVFRASWICVNVSLLISVAAFLFCLGWEFSVRNYLKGFSDAIIPYSSTPEQKAESILAWMQYGPARRTSASSNLLNPRDPEETLNYKELLQVCGTATNAFVNLAYSSGLQARRLLLLDSNRSTKHVVVEVHIDGRWVVVDPAFRIFFRDAQGRFLTRDQLRDPAIFRQATGVMPNYPSSYTYESTTHVRLSRIPEVGRYLRILLDRVWPGWDEAVNWTLLVERESFTLLMASATLLSLLLLCRLFLNWYGKRRFGFVRVRMRDQVWRAGAALFSHSK